MFWDVLSTFVNVVGNLKEGSAQSKAATFNANNSRFNAGVSRVQGKLEEDKVRRASRQRIGLIRANVGASGLDGGSADDVLAQSTYEAELDALTTRYNYDSQATSYDMQAKMYDSSGKDASQAGYINAASSLLKGGKKIWEQNNDYDAGTTPFILGGG